MEELPNLFPERPLFFAKCEIHRILLIVNHIDTGVG